MKWLILQHFIRSTLFAKMRKKYNIFGIKRNCQTHTLMKGVDPHKMLHNAISWPGLVTRIIRDLA